MISGGMLFLIVRDDNEKVIVRGMTIRIKLIVLHTLPEALFGFVNTVYRHAEHRGHLL